jgi:acylphosphatase
MIVARRYVVRGRVQGVGFRYFADAAARREGLSGFVRNTPEGAVEAVVEGDEEAVGRFDLAIRRGPPASRVESVELDTLPPTGRYSGFHVRG